MPTYIQTATNSNITPFTNWNKTLASIAPGDGSFSTSVPSGTPNSGGWITSALTPNNDGWGTGGTWTVNITIDIGGASVNGMVRCLRLSNSGTILQAGGYTAEQQMSAGAKVFLPVAPDWSNGACTDRLSIHVSMRNLFLKPVTIHFGIGTSAEKVITNVAENLCSNVVFFGCNF